MAKGLYRSVPYAKESTDGENPLELAGAAATVATTLLTGANPEVVRQVQEIADKIKHKAKGHELSEEQWKYIEANGKAFIERLKVINGKASLEEMKKLLKENNGLLSRFARSSGLSTEMTSEDIKLLEEAIDKRIELRKKREAVRIDSKRKADEAIENVSDLFKEQKDKAAESKRRVGPEDTEFQVNDISDVYGRSTAIATSTDGEILITWQQSHRTHATIYNAQGAVKQSDFQVTPNVSAYSTATFLTTGRYLIVYIGSYTISHSRNDMKIFAKAYNPDGTVLRDNFLVSEGGVYPIVIPKPNGGFMVIYAGEKGIDAKEYDANAMEIGTISQLNTFKRYPRNPSAASLSDGGYVVSYCHGTAHAEIFNADNSRRVSGIPANTAPEFHETQLLPQVAVLPEDNIIFAWQKFNEDSSSTIYTRILNNCGEEISPITQVNEHPIRTNYDKLTITTLVDGGYVIAWTNLVDGAGLEVLGRRYNPDFTPDEKGVFSFNTFSKYSQLDASVAKMPDGGFTAVWYSSGDQTGIFGQRFDKDSKKIELQQPDLVLPTISTNETSTKEPVCAITVQERPYTGQYYTKQNIYSPSLVGFVFFIEILAGIGGAIALTGTCLSYKYIANKRRMARHRRNHLELQAAAANANHLAFIDIPNQNHHDIEAPAIFIADDNNANQRGGDVEMLEDDQAQDDAAPHDANIAAPALLAPVLNPIIPLPGGYVEMVVAAAEAQQAEDNGMGIGG